MPIFIVKWRPKLLLDSTDYLAVKVRRKETPSKVEGLAQEDHTVSKKGMTTHQAEAKTCCLLLVSIKEAHVYSTCNTDVTGVDYVISKTVKTRFFKMSSHYNRHRGRSPPRGNSSKYSRNRSRSPRRDSYNGSSGGRFGGGGYGDGGYGGYRDKKLVLIDNLSFF